MSITRPEQKSGRPVLSLMSGMLAGLVLGAPAQASFNPLSGPILTAPAVPPNVVMLFDNSSSMVLNRIGNQTRLTIARDAAKRLVRLPLHALESHLAGARGAARQRAGDRIPRAWRGGLAH